MPETRHAEFENLNRYRSYPFSDSSSLEDAHGVAFPNDAIVDAALYPVNPDGDPELVLFDPMGGVAEVSCGSVSLKGSISAGSSSVELYQGGRHAGTLVAGPGFDREVASGRRREFNGTAVFASAAVCPVRHDGVTSVVFADRGSYAVGWLGMVFAGKGRMTAKSSRRPDGDMDVFFDVEAKSRTEGDGSGSGGSSTEDSGGYIRQIHVAVVGKTLFRADPELPGGAYLWLANADWGKQGEDAGLDRDDVCSRAHLGDEIQVVRDTCGVDSKPCNPESDLPSKSESFVINGCNVSLLSYDLSNYRNPLKIEVLSVPSVRQVPSVPSGILSVEKFGDEVSKLVATPVQAGNGIEISIPGVAHG